MVTNLRKEAKAMWKKTRRFLSVAILLVLICCFVSATYAEDLGLFMNFCNVSGDKTISVDKVLCNDKNTGISFSGLAPGQEILKNSPLCEGEGSLEIGGTWTTTSDEPPYLETIGDFDCKLIIKNWESCTSNTLQIGATKSAGSPNWTITLYTVPK